MLLSQLEVIQEGLDGMHAMLDGAVPDMTADQWNARPAGDGVSAFFSVIRPTPPMTIWQALTGMLLYHGFRHVGEIEHARGLLGLGGLTI